MSPEIPIIDIGKFLSARPEDRMETVREVQRALEEIGFLIISGHGVPEPLIDRVSKATLAFFDRPEDEKMRFSVPGRPNRGYGAMRSRTVGIVEDATLKRSLQEGYGLGRMERPSDPRYMVDAVKGAFVDNIFPDEPKDFEPAIRDYYAKVSDVFRTMMRVFAVALELPEDYFAPMMTNSDHTLRLTHYPALDRPPEPGELRAGAHTDTGIMTILHIDDTPDSLEVKTRSGEWIFVNRVPGTFVVNVGDLLMRWTNDKWVSNSHRVVNPPFVNGRAARRLSIVTFCQVNSDTMIKCLPTCQGPGNPPRYEPITSEEYKRGSYSRLYGLKPQAAE